MSAKTGPSSRRWRLQRREPAAAAQRLGLRHRDDLGPGLGELLPKSRILPCSAADDDTRHPGSAASPGTRYAASGRPPTRHEGLGLPTRSVTEPLAFPPREHHRFHRSRQTRLGRPIDSYTNQAARASSGSRRSARRREPRVFITPSGLLVRKRRDLVPLGDDHGRVGAAAARRAGSRAGRRPGSSGRASSIATGSQARTCAPSASRRDGEHEARRLPHVVRVRLEGEAEQRDRLAAQRAEMLRQLADHPALLELVDLDHRR